jgi:hypothetical protein
MYFTLHLYFVQNKYVPHTINSCPTPQRTNGAPRGRVPQFENLCDVYLNVINFRYYESCTKTSAFLA